MSDWCRPVQRSQSFRKWRLIAALAPLCLLLSVVVFQRLPSVRADEHSAGPFVLELSLDGEVEPILATYIDEGLADASRRHATLVLINMDTPGGLSDSMKDMVQHILVSPVPVAVYVSPTGARGASAGFYILLSADIAAMAPGTHAGAASPIIAIGGFPQQIDEVFRRKINQDAMAFLRSFSERRKRNPELAEKAITESRAFTEKEALDAKMIDLVVNSTEELLRQLDGRTITRFDGTQVTLVLKNASRVPFELSARQRFLARIVEPDVFFVLLILGVLGLYTEFTHPGLFAPGVIGGICLLLALYAMHILPVNVAGVFLIFLALALFLLEAKFPSHGVLGAGGVVAMFLGAIFLIRSPLTGGGVSVSVALAATLPFAVFAVFLARLVMRSRKWKPSTGTEDLVGMQGVVLAAIPGIAAGTGNEGMIRVRGELWRATAPQTIPAGQAVRVSRVDGLTLHVEAAQGSARRTSLRGTTFR